MKYILFIKNLFFILFITLSIIVLYLKINPRIKRFFILLLSTLIIFVIYSFYDNICSLCYSYISCDSNHICNCNTANGLLKKDLNKYKFIYYIILPIISAFLPFISMLIFNYIRKIKCFFSKKIKIHYIITKNKVLINQYNNITFSRNKYSNYIFFGFIVNVISFTIKSFYDGPKYSYALIITSIICVIICEIIGINNVTIKGIKLKLNELFSPLKSCFGIEILIIGSFTGFINHFLDINDFTLTEEIILICLTFSIFALICLIVFLIGEKIIKYLKNIII